MGNDRLQSLLAVHSNFVMAAQLHRDSRPYSVQSNLSTIEDKIMKEIFPKPPTNTNDTPF